MDIQKFFASHARISRKMLARFAGIDTADLDAAADGLGYGQLLRLDEAEELIDDLEGEDDTDDEDIPDDEDSDPDDDADEDA